MSPEPTPKSSTLRTGTNAPALHDVPATLLCVGDSESLVVSGRAGALPTVIRMQIGSGTAGHLPLRQHDWPTVYELENAIAVVEDEVMPLSRRLPRPSVLLGIGGALEAVARIAGKAGPGKVHLALADVELLFQQLAAVSQGLRHRAACPRACRSPRPC